jgi:prephenate dehydratase
MPTLACLGPAGTYSEEAAVAFIQQNPQFQLTTHNTIEQAIIACAQGTADMAIVPTENSLYGSVGSTLDSLWQWTGLQITQSLVLPIRHHLLSWADALSQIHTVYSHPQGLGQCQQWLAQSLPHAQPIPVDSTTYGVQLAKDNHQLGAIASARAAEIYGVPILAHDISDNATNSTRFLVLANLANQPTQREGKFSSWGFSFAENRAGTLARALNALADRAINLTRIESRPSKRSLGEYIFFIDIAGNRHQQNVEEAWQELSQITETLKDFGSYDLITIS